VEFGCPLNNLAQEMSPLDRRFRQEIEAICREWRSGLATALERGKAEGSVRSDVDSAAVAAFLVASIEGSYGLAKGTKDGGILRDNFGMLEYYLEKLR
jgi:TetR/AcrR family transcriptional repressor of nem operon